MSEAKYKLKTEAEIPPLGIILYTKATFDIASNKIKHNKGVVHISARDLAYARCKLGQEHSLSQHGSYVKEGSLYVPDSENRIILTRDSLVLKDPKKSTDSHRRGKEYFVFKKQSNEIIEKVHSNDNSVYALHNLNPIPTNRFGEDERTVWLFGDMAKKYGNFLRKSKYEIKEMPLLFNAKDYIDSQENPYANQLWVRRLEVNSEINANWSLNYIIRTRGVLASKTSTKNLEVGKSTQIKTYTPDEIFKAVKKSLKELKLSGLEKEIISTLEKRIKIC